MKTFLKFTIFFLFSYTAFSQNNVGIGTINPSSNAILHLDNGASDLGLLLPNVDHTTFNPGTGVDPGLMIYDDNEGKVYTWDGNTWVSSTSEWGVNGNDIFSLNSGNVGIGTNLPGEKLTVVDNVLGAIASLNSSALNTLMDFNNTSANPANWRFGYLGNTGGNPGYMTFLRGSHRFVVTNNGDVGIAVTNPQARLEINSSGNSSASYAMLINNSNPTNIFAVQDDGNVGIGTINPDETLTVGDPLGVGYVFPAISVGGATSGGGLVIGSPTNYFNIDHGNTFSRGRIISTDVGGYGQGDIEFRVGGIGINTPTPQNDLDVEGAVAIGSAYSGTNIAPANGMIVEGQVGIGTNSILSSNKLQINTGPTQNYSLALSNDYIGGLAQYGINNQIIQSTGSVFGIYGSYGTNGTNPFYGMRLFYFGSGTGTRYGLTISNEDVNYFSGNLGIGSTATPTSTLQVNGTGQISGRLELTATTDASGTINTGVLEIANSLRIDGNEIITNTLNPIFFQQGNDGDFVVNFSTLHVDGQSDNVGIMTSSPVSDLHIKQTTSTFPNPSTGGLILEESGSTNRWQIWASNPFCSFAYNGVRVGYVNSSSGAWVPTSDARLKKDVGDMSPVLDKVNQLRPVSYKFNDRESQETTIGFLAQEVEPLFPEVVSKDPGNDGYYGVAYGQMSVIAIKAIQELKAENEELKARIEALESK